MSNTDLKPLVKNQLQSIEERVIKLEKRTKRKLPVARSELSDKVAREIFFKLTDIRAVQGHRVAKTLALLLSQLISAKTISRDEVDSIVSGAISESRTGSPRKAK